MLNFKKRICYNKSRQGGNKILTTIYIDVLVVLNIYVTYCLMLSTSKLSGIVITKRRLFATSILGGIFSLIILLNLTLTLQIISKFIMGAILIIVGFGIKNKNRFLKVSIYFFTTNFLYGGVMLGVFIVFAPNIMAYKNGVVYFNITALNLVISTIVAYIIVNIIIRVLDKKVKTEDIAIVKIKFLGREVMLTGLIDTGNKLNDIFTGLPVIVCEYEGVEDLFPSKLKEYFQNTKITMLNDTSYATKIRLVPINVVGAKTVLPAFKPDEVVISNEIKEVIVAVTNQKLTTGEFNAII